MPMKKGKTQETISGNISEFHKGDTYAHTKAKFGKRKADKQAVAAAMNAAGQDQDKVKHTPTGGLHKKKL